MRFALTMAILAGLTGQATDMSWTEIRAGIHVKPASRETILVRDEMAMVRIGLPTGDAWREAIEPVRAILRSAGLQQSAEVDAEQLVRRDGLALADPVMRPLSDGGKHLILVGTAGSNAALARLYIDYYAYEDAMLPGAGGHTVRTVLNPYGLGWNVIILGGATPATASRAAAAWAKTLTVANGVATAGCLQQVTPGKGSEETVRRTAAFRGWLKANQELLAAPGTPEFAAHAGKLSPVKYFHRLFERYVAMCGLHYAVSGDAFFADQLGQMVDRLYGRMDWLDANRGKESFDSHYWIEIYVRGAQQALHSGMLDAERRQKMAALLAYLAEKYTIYQWQYGPGGQSTFRILSRHQFAGPFGANATIRYLKRISRLDEGLSQRLDAIQAGVRVAIDQQMTSYCTGFDHKWGLDGGWHLLQHALEEPVSEYRRSGLARMNADYACMCINNAGEFVNFGSENVGATEGYDAWTLLGRAELLCGDGTYRWWMNRRAHDPYKMFILSMTWQGHGYMTSGAAHEPRRFVGINRLPISTPIFEDIVAGRGRVYAGTPKINKVSYEHTFSKITFRDSLARDGAYLMLDGLGGTTYSGNDANAIAEFSEFGTPLLVQIEMKAEPFYQNAISVSRGITASAVPVFAELDLQADLPKVMVTTTRLADYADTTWTRRIVRMKGAEKTGFFLVVDDVAVHRGGDVSLSCTFRSLGEPILDGNSWRVRQERASLRLDCVPVPGENAALLSTAVRSPDLGAGNSALTVQILRQTRAEQFRDGDHARFVNCFYGSPADTPISRQTQAVSRNVFRIEGPEGVTVVAIGTAGPVRLGPIQADAALTVLSGNSLSLFGLRGLEVDGKPLLLANGTIHAALDLERSTLTLQTTRLKNPRTVVWTPEETVQLALDKADGQVRVGDSTVRIERIDLLPKAITTALASMPHDAVPPVAHKAASTPSPKLQVTELAHNLAPAPLPASCVAVADLDGDKRQEVVFGGPDRALTAMRVDDESVLWRAVAPGPILGIWAGLGRQGNPAVLCATANATVSAFDIDGKLLWTHRSKQKYYGSSGAIYRVTAGPLGANGEWLAVAGLHGGISVLDAKGAVLRSTKVYAHAIDQLTPLGDHGVGWIALNSKASGLWLYRPATGTLVNGYARQWGTTGYVQTPCVLDGRNVLLTATSNGAGCFVLDAAAMANPAPKSVQAAGTWSLKSGEEVHGLVSIDDAGDTRLICGTRTGFLSVFDTAGKLRMQKLLPSPVSGLATIDLGGDTGRVLLAMGHQPQLTILTRDCHVLGSWTCEGETALENVWKIGVKRLLARFADGRVALLELGPLRVQK
ncbi:MAG: hypothetical protein KAI66_04545 [Lentisphaeria bacterium]|nr:hypothetical protein [Lentisphaeria bacterium]